MDQTKDTFQWNCFFYSHHLSLPVKISQEEQKVIIGEKILNLEKSPMIMKVFGYFSIHRKLKIQDLVQHLYGVNLEKVSSRMGSSLKHNTVKLLSRSRNLAQKEIQDENFYIEWFPYDARTRAWNFYRWEPLGSYLLDNKPLLSSVKNDY